MRQMSMMQQRHVPWVLGALGSGLMCAALAGCGSVVASSTAADPAAPAATTAAPATAAPATGCAGTSQATKVVVRRVLRVSLPVGDHTAVVTQTKPALVRALLRDLCAAAAHPSPAHGVMHCPANFGNDYAGTFYDGSRVLGSFIYSASGCRGLTLVTPEKTQSTLVTGSAAAAAPHLTADLASVLGVPVSQLTQSGEVDPGGPQQPGAAS
jgi:hypothetical protein